MFASSTATLRAQDTSSAKPLLLVELREPPRTLAPAIEADKGRPSEFMESPLVSPIDRGPPVPLATNPRVGSPEPFNRNPDVNSATSPPVSKPTPATPVLHIFASNVVVTAGGEIAWPIEITIEAGLITNEKVSIAGLPSAAKLSRGTRGGDGVWTLGSADLAGLTLTMPLQASNARVTVVLTSSMGIELARLTPTIDVRPPVNLNAASGKNELEDRALGLLAQGEAYLKTGDVVGARMFFKKAADAGDARAAIAMGMTYDPKIFASLKVRGMVPDVQAARRWYQRAVDLGSKDAYDRLDQLK